MMKSYPMKVYLISFLAVMIISCTERIDITLDDSYIRLVVEGSITTDTLAHKVILTKSTSYYFNQSAPMVTDAIVSISTGDIRYDLKEVEPGVYCTEPTVYGITGNVYTLNIRLSDQLGGYSDYTASSTLNPVNTLDSVRLYYHPDWSEKGFWEVRSFFQDSPGKDYYRFIISRNNEIITDTLDEWFVTDDIFLNGNYAYDTPVAFLDQSTGDERLNSGDKLMVEMNGIGKDYAEFLMEAQSELMGSNPLFGGPPANVKGNINNGAIGFFAAYSTSRSFTITP
jgi:hypothetical protein